MLEQADNQRLIVPREHGTTLVRPQPFSATDVLAANIDAIDRFDLQIAGRSLGDLRRQARSEVLSLAIQHSAAYREVPKTLDADQPIIISGHQPALFHPGVWFKNFLADKFATGTRGVAINVIIDSDIAPAPSIATLSGTLDNPKPGRVAYDQAGARCPWEMTNIRSKQTFASFDQRLTDQLCPFVQDPLVNVFWKYVLNASENGKNIGLSFSEARHRLEEQAGLQLLDVPWSSLSQTQWYVHFVAEILLRASEFRTVYNSEVERYRKSHKIRSTSHPVPNLESENGWIEVPFWIYTTENPMRRRAWAKLHANQIELSDRATWTTSLPIANLVDGLIQLQKKVHLRTRALTTTMVMRLIASDVMVHGIGGSQYDLVTNAIISRMFQLKPPQYITATATALLPVRTDETDEDGLLQMNRKLRDAYFNPNRLLQSDRHTTSDVQQLIAQKEKLIRDVPSFPEKRAWHQQLEQVNQQLRAHVVEKEESLREKRAQWEVRLKQKRILQSREYSFCMFPHQTLIDLLLDLAQKEA